MCKPELTRPHTSAYCIDVLSHLTGWRHGQLPGWPIPESGPAPEDLNLQKYRCHNPNLSLTVVNKI